MRFNVKSEAPCLSILAAMFALAIWAWPRAAERIAVHFGVDGVANGFGGKEALLYLPVMASVLYIASMLRMGEPARSPAGLVLWREHTPRIGVLAVLFAVHAMLVARAVGSTMAWDVVSVAAGAFVIVLGNYLPKTQPNEFIGARTPWTLRSDLSWHRTHRLAGWLLIATGIATVVTAAARPDAAMGVLVAMLIASGLVAAVYSYVVWRHDPARRGDESPRLLD